MSESEHRVKNPCVRGDETLQKKKPSAKLRLWLFLLKSYPIEVGRSLTFPCQFLSKPYEITAAGLKLPRKGLSQDHGCQTQRKPIAEAETDGELFKDAEKTPAIEPLLQAAPR